MRQKAINLSQFLLAVLCAGLASASLPTSLAAASSGTGDTERQEKSAALAGVFGFDPAAILRKSFKNARSPEDIFLQAPTVAKEKEINLKEDPAKNCQPLGPFRMMARDGNKIELLSSPGRISTLFENIALGHMRTIYLDRPHLKNPPLTWEGDSIGHWEGDALVVDTTGFNEHVWLNAAGASHGSDFHLVERYRLVHGGGTWKLKCVPKIRRV